MQKHVNDNQHWNDEQHCPLCKQANQCALASNEPASSCWCQQVTFNEALLQGIAVTQTTKRCICKHCAEKSRQLTMPAK